MGVHISLRRCTLLLLLVNVFLVRTMYLLLTRLLLDAVFSKIMLVSTLVLFHCGTTISSVNCHMLYLLYLIFRRLVLHRAILFLLLLLYLPSFPISLFIVVEYL